MNSSSSISIASALAALPLATAAAAQPEARVPVVTPERAAQVAGLTAEAAAFMTTYAADLRAGDRAAITARYDRRGAWQQGNGDSVFEPWTAIRDHYADQRWQPPVSFEWRDLVYEPAGPDSVLVAGTFLWGRAAGQPPYLFSYTGLLVRRDGVLRIRLEHESMRPMRAEPAS